MADRITLLKDSIDCIMEMEDAEAGAVLKALVQVVDGEEPDLGQMAKALKYVFPMIAGQVLRSADLSEQRAAAGRNGGRPLKQAEANESKKKQIEANESKKKQIEANESKKKQNKANESVGTGTYTGTSTGTEKGTRTSTETGTEREGAQGAPERAAEPLTSPAEPAPTLARSARPSPAGPSIAEVRRFSHDEQLDLDAERFVNYYNATGWKRKNGKKVDDWREVARSWARDQQRYNGREEKKIEHNYQERDYSGTDWDDVYERLGAFGPPAGSEESA